MLTTATYHVSPAYKCHCPGRAFRRAQEALSWAREAAALYRTPYSVCRTQAGRTTLLWRFDGDPGPRQ
jgi:hypothetical protein